LLYKDGCLFSLSYLEAEICGGIDGILKTNADHISEICLYRSSGICFNDK